MQAAVGAAAGLVIPFLLGTRDAGLLVLTGYTAVAAALLTLGIRMTGPKYHRPSREETVRATIARAVAIFLVGGTCYVAGLLLFGR